MNITKGAPVPVKNTLARLFSTLFRFYPVMMPLTLVCILFSAVVSSIPAVFMQNVIAAVEASWQSGDWGAAAGRILPLVGILCVFYVLSLAAAMTFTQLMAVITQGFLRKLRENMFSRMQDLPIRYFDTNNHGDVMSYYTNDIDTLRQMISQSFPQLVSAGVVVITIFAIMIYYSVWLALVVIAGVVCMALVTKHVGGGSARYFIRQQHALGKVEGFVEEMMTGQKVVKVFCHEEKSLEQFRILNNQLRESADKANTFSNISMPINANLGNVSYVLCAVTGAIFALNGYLGLTLGTLVSFLTLNKNSTQPVSQISQQLNSIVMAMAGAQRIFDLMDEEPEEDDGYVTLVNVREESDGTLTETQERTNLWAWKHPHKADGTVTYQKLEGDITFDDVDFGYEEGKIACTTSNCMPPRARRLPL